MGGGGQNIVCAKLALPDLKAKLKSYGFFLCLTSARLDLLRGCTSWTNDKLKNTCIFAPVDFPYLSLNCSEESATQANETLFSASLSLGFQGKVKLKMA